MEKRLGDRQSMLKRFEELALAAGCEIMACRAKGFSVDTKSDSSPVTIADQRAEAVILAGLRAAWPDIPIVAEEEVSSGRCPPALGDAFFLVDPLDGTREFVNDRDDFTVNIALVERGVPTVGIVHAPARGSLCAGRPGYAETASVSADGRVLERQAVTMSQCGQAARIVASRSHRTAETDDFIARFDGAEIVSVGSSLKFCLLASGKADIYPRLGRTMEWDTAAGDAVLRAAGGTTVTRDGAPLLYGKRNQPDDSDFANPHFIAFATLTPEWSGQAGLRPATAG